MTCWKRELVEVLAEVRSLAYVAEYLEGVTRDDGLRVFAGIVHAVCVKVGKELSSVIESLEK